MADELILYKYRDFNNPDRFKEIFIDQKVWFVFCFRRNWTFPEKSCSIAAQFIARDFKEFIRISGMTHVKTSLYYPQSNGKLERRHRTIGG